ncbi:30S ribosomal protein S5 [Candidatus Micrarchaeota archaeon CG08_land_8_20_14_0_20_59_11]|nr:MAG: 30S ribosomal protein S5 [Candidatus Micrarchaeota archaeon CG08_land_8_20_14_0_20_59_11]
MKRNAFNRGARDKRDEQSRTANWVPKTKLGRKVLNGEITSVDEIFDSGQRILESHIIDILIPDLSEDVLEVKSTQRMSACGRKQQMRAVAVVGNRAGYVGVGVGKAPETRDAISEAISEAKRNLVRVRLGCGSWECGCGTEHSLAQQVNGQNSSTTIIIKPAPRGVGIVASENVRKVLELAGVHDAWTFMRGRTRNVLNAVLATMQALDSLNVLKSGRHGEEVVADA